MEAASKRKEDDLVKILLGDPVFFKCTTGLSHESNGVVPGCNKMADVVRIGIWDWLGWSNEDVKEEIKKIPGMGKCKTFMQRETLDNAHRNDTWVRPEATHWDALWCCNCGEARESVTERRPHGLSDLPASWSHFLGENLLSNESNVQNERKDEQSMQNDHESDNSITSGGSWGEKWGLVMGVDNTRP